MSIGSLTKGSAIPLYHQVKCILMDAIEAGQWQLGQQLPTENQFVEDFGVSKITIRQALQELADLGYVRREQGRGTFVAKTRFDQGPRELTSFSEEMQRHRLKASSRVLEQYIGKAESQIAEALELRPGEPVFVLKRLRMADGEAMGIQTAHVPAALVSGLVNENFEHASLYEILQTRYGLQAARARESHFAALAEPAAADLLGIVSGSPVLAAERVTLLSTGKPLEYVKSVMRGDRYSIVLELVGNRTPQARREGATRRTSSPSIWAAPRPPSPWWMKPGGLRRSGSFAPPAPLKAPSSRSRPVSPRAQRLPGWLFQESASRARATPGPRICGTGISTRYATLWSSGWACL